MPSLPGVAAVPKTKRIIIIQKRAIRTITKSFHTAHTEPRMKKLGLLKFEDLYKLDINLLAHDCLYGNAPKNIRNLTKLAQNTSHILRNQVSKPLSLKVPNFKSRAGSHSFRQVGPTVWNIVPNEQQSISQKVIFKRAMKKSILENYEKKAVCTNPRCKDKGNHLCTG